MPIIEFRGKSRYISGFGCVALALGVPGIVLSGFGLINCAIESISPNCYWAVPGIALVALPALYAIQLGIDAVMRHFKR